MHAADHVDTNACILTCKHWAWIGHTFTTMTHINKQNCFKNAFRWQLSFHQNTKQQYHKNIDIKPLLFLKIIPKAYCNKTNTNGPTYKDGPTVHSKWHDNICGSMKMWLWREQQNALKNIWQDSFTSVRKEAKGCVWTAYSCKPSVYI